MGREGMHVGGNYGGWWWRYIIERSSSMSPAPGCVMFAWVMCTASPCHITTLTCFPCLSAQPCGRPIGSRARKTVALLWRNVLAIPNKNPNFLKYLPFHSEEIRNSPHLKHVVAFPVQISCPNFLPFVCSIWVCRLGMYSPRVWSRYILVLRLV